MYDCARVLENVAQLYAGSRPHPSYYSCVPSVLQLKNAARIRFDAGSLPHPHCYLGLLENAACACLVLARFLTLIVI